MSTEDVPIAEPIEIPEHDMISDLCVSTCEGVDYSDDWSTTENLEFTDKDWDDLLESISEGLNMDPSSSEIAEIIETLKNSQHSFP